MITRSCRVRVKWLVICASIIIVLCSLFLSYSLYSQSLLRQDEESACQRRVLAQKAAVDDSLNSLLNYSMSLINNSMVKSLDDADTIEKLRHLKAYRLTTEIQNRVNFLPFLEDVYIYYPNSDCVVGKNGVYPIHAYWATLHGINHTIEYDQWFESLFQDIAYGYFFLIHTGETQLFSRISATHTGTRILISEINMQTLKSQLSLVSADLNGGFAAILTDDHTVVASSAEISEFIDPETHRLLPLSNDYICNMVDSDIPGMHYIVIMEKTSAYLLSDTIAKIALAFLILAVLIGCTLAYVLVRKGVMPIEDLANKLSPGQKKRVDEVTRIDFAFDEILKAQSSLELALKQQQITICQSFFDELLRQDPNEKSDPYLIASIYGLTIDNANFCVIARKRVSDVCKEQIYDMLISMDEDNLISWTNFCDVDVFLLNYDTDEASIQTEFLKKLQNLSDRPADIAVSKTVDTALLIMSCWVDCAKQLGCTHLLPKTYLRKNAYHTDPVNTTLEQVRQRLDLNDFAYVKSMAGSVFTQYVYDASPFYFQYKKYHTVHMLLPYCPPKSEHALTNLVNSKNEEEWVANFCEVISCCQYRPTSEECPTKKAIVIRIRNTIEQQYSNPALDLRMLAEDANFSQPYLSRIFKEWCGLSIHQYINQVRIQHAKELIVNGNITIKEIALAVGFSGDAQFIRAFKKLEGVTPGTLRNEN